MRTIPRAMQLASVSALLIFCASHSYSQFFDLSEQVKVARRSSLSIELIQIGQDINAVAPTLLGSGFYVNKSGIPYAITNAHVVGVITKRHQLLVGANLKHGKAYLSAQIVKVETQIDVAILKLGDVLYYSGDKLEFNQAFIGISLFVPDSAIMEGMPIFLIGYPLNIGIASSGNQPVTRMGIVGQSVDSAGTFLIDGNVSHGNSGSPVFSAQTRHLLGMVIGFRGDQIDFTDNLGNLVARLPHNSGLSLCVASSRILNLIP